MLQNRWISCSESLQLIPALFAMSIKPKRAKKTDQDQIVGGRVFLYHRNKDLTIHLDIPEDFLKHLTNEDITPILAQLFAEIKEFTIGKHKESVFEVKAWWDSKIHNLYKYKQEKEAEKTQKNPKQPEKRGGKNPEKQGKTGQNRAKPVKNAPSFPSPLS